MIPVVGEWIAQCPGTISLGQGVVHYGPPPEVAEAVVAAVREDARVHRYGLVRGTDDLLSAIQTKLQADNQTTLEQRTVVTTAGSNMGFVNAVLAIADVGDEIILLSPFYFNHEMAIDIAGCTAVCVPTDANYQMDLERIEAAITPRTRAIVTVSPSNPTGAVYSQESLDAVNRMCERHGVYHISDEAYEYFVYGEHSHYSPASRAGSEPHTISLYSLSKAYGMAGWRTGYMVIPSHLETSVKKIQDTNLVCPPIVSQLAATAALQAGAAWCRRQIEPFRDVRDLVMERLAGLGDRCRVPRSDGAFYALLQLDTALSDLVVVERLIREFGIAVMPGNTFGVNEGCAVRLAYGALAKDTVSEGIGRLVRGLEAILH
jgi:aspartate/methionine/tyrosine aminotransferase